MIPSAQMSIMDHTENYVQGNKEAWEEAFERRSPEWGSDIVQRVKTEKLPFLSRELAVELEQLNLTGKTIGQFCCNNGRELLSIVKQGAREGVGFDIAENQVQFANGIAAALNMHCTFVATDILQIDASYDDRFDLLLITIGSLCWFKDLSLFFNRVARCTKKHGVVLVHEQHPVTNMLAIPGEENYDEQRPGKLVNSYFQNTWIESSGMPYISGQAYASKTFTSYTHSLSAIITAAIESGLQVCNLQEFDRDLSGDFTPMENKGIPLSYILKLRK